MSRPGQLGAVVWLNELYKRHHQHQQQGWPNYFTRNENPPKIFCQKQKPTKTISPYMKNPPKLFHQKRKPTRNILPKTKTHQNYFTIYEKPSKTISPETKTQQFTKNKNPPEIARAKRPKSEIICVCIKTRNKSKRVNVHEDLLIIL